MYTQRKKKIIIITVSIIVALVVLLVGGIVLYATTDFLKSNDTLFYKYMASALDNLQYGQNAQLEGIAEAIAKNSYEMNAEVTFEDGNTGNSLMDGKLKYIDDKTENNEFCDINLTLNNQNLFNMQYAKSNNIYALKSDEIATAFIGIENDNLKVLAQKFGIKDTSQIPNSININNNNNSINIKELLNITDAEKKHISETYLQVLQKSIDSKKFTKEMNLAINKRRSKL